MSATIALILRVEKKNDKGECPIRIRITKNRKSSYASTGLRIDEKNWDFKKQKVKSSHPNSSRVNHHLNTLINRYQDEILKAETLDTTLSTKKIKGKINGINESLINFYDVAEKVTQKYYKANKIAIYSRAISVIKKVKEFSQTDKLEITDIDVRFLKKYEEYFKNTRDNATNTINKDFGFIRRVFSEAYQNELIVFEKNPFSKFKIENEKTTKIYLTEDELNRMIDVDLTKKKIHDLHRDMFVFSSGAGGLRISDMLLLKWQDFDQTHIRFNMRKTKGQLSIKLPKNSMKILEKYKCATSNKADFIFPVLNPAHDFSNAMTLHRAVSSATAHINKNLKEIAALAQINKRVTTHIARHTFATRALTKGISLDKVSKLLGHSHVRDTQVYAKIINTELDNAMDIFNN